MPLRSHHGDAEWRLHLNDMAEWYLKDRVEHEEIAERLAARGFVTGAFSVKTKLQEWRCRRRQNDFDLMAQCFLHHKSQGSIVNFTRFGKNVPRSEITNTIEQKPYLEGTDHALPEHIQVVFENAGHVTDPTSRINSGANAQSTSPPRMSAKRQRTDHSDDLQQSRKHKIPSGPPTQQQQQSTSNDKKDDAEEDAISDTEDIDDAQTMDHDGQIRSQQRSKEREMKKAFAMLQKLTSKDTKATEAVQHAQEVLTESLKEDITLRKLKDRTDTGPLHSAAMKSDKSSAKSLLEYGTNINARGGTGLTALHIASSRGHLDFVGFLLQQPDIDVNARCNKGGTPLMYALAQPWRHCALLLLQHGAKVDAVDDDSKSALHYACTEPGMDRLVHIIVAKDTNLNLQDKFGRTPLHRAFCLNHDEYVAPLLEKGANLNVPDREGRTPFMQACFEASTDMLMLLLQYEVDLTMKGNKGETALHILCQNGRHEVVQQVLSRTDVDIDAKSRISLTPLMLAARNGHKDTVYALVNKEANLNICDIDSDTALIHAIDHGHIEIADFLIKSGSPVNPMGHSMLKWRTQVENEHKSEQELFALNSRPSQIRGTSQPVPHTNISIQMQSEESIHQVQQNKVQDTLNYLMAQMAELQSTQQTVSGLTTRHPSTQFNFNNPLPTYGSYQNPHHFGGEMDMGMNYIL